MTVTSFTIPALTVAFPYKGIECQIPLPAVRVKCYSTTHLRKVADGLEAYDEYSAEYICHHLENRGATFEAIEDALRAEHGSRSLEGLVTDFIEDWGDLNDDARPIRIQWAKHMAAHIRAHLKEY